MASAIKMDLPPGFEELSREEQVRYAQMLWEYVAPSSDEVPAPDWHVEQAEARIDEYIEGKASAVSWADARAQVLKGRADDGA